MDDNQNTGPVRPAPLGALPCGNGSLLPIITSASALYEAARNRAIHECQLDRLFNPDYYAAQSDE